VPKNKVVPIEEAMSHVKSGMSIAVGGFIGQGDPLTLIDYLKTMDVGDLTIYENDAGYRERGVASSWSSRARSRRSSPATSAPLPRSARR